jgi:hypothetical protein
MARIVSVQIAISIALSRLAFEIAHCRKVLMPSGDHVYREIWTPEGNDEILAILVSVEGPDGAQHFEAEVTADRLEVEKFSAETLDELKSLLAEKYRNHTSRR